jgi:multidrug efflux pump subunit AcrA (membrane-fusion protein)
VVSSVGTVASGSGSSATITMQVSLTDPKAAGGLDQAPVQVAITTGSVTNVLVVPVDALLARANGGYAVEVTGAGGHHLVPVTPGLFDDAAGLVQVTGAGLAAGQHVVVPAL